MKLQLCATIFLSILIATGIALADQPDSKGNSGSQKIETDKNPAEKLNIDWLKYDKGLELAKEKDKKVFVEFTAKWCGFCKKMHATTFKDPEIIKLLNKYFVTVSVDGDSRDTLNIDGWITSEKKLTREYRVTGYPTYWFLTPESDPIAPVKGYRDAKTLGYILDYLKDDTYKTVKFEDYLAEKRQEERSGN